MREKFRRSDAVFPGKVVEMTPTEPAKDFPLASYLVRFEVERRWEGDPGREVTAAADFDMPATCGGLRPAIGGSFLIYAPRKKGRLRVLTDCGPSTSAEYAGKEMKRLDSFLLRAKARLYTYPKL